MGQQGQPTTGQQPTQQFSSGRSQGGQSQAPIGGQPQGMQQGQSQQSSWGQPPSAPPATQQGPGGPGGQSSGRPGATQFGPAPLEPVSIEDIARTEVVTAEREDTVESIVEDMAENNVGSVVVVEEDRPVGIVTDRTITLALRETPDVVEQTAEELMADDLATADLESDAFEVLDRMSETGVRRIPIVDEDGELKGIVTLDDVLLFLEDNLHTVAETVRAQFPDL